MAAKGYTSLQRIAAYMAREFTAAQAAEANALLEPAERRIDLHTGRSWAQTLLVANEPHTAYGREVFLDKRPVASVSQVVARTPTPGSSLLALGAFTGYELLSPERGLLVVAEGYVGWLLSVSYTPAVPVDPLVSLATTMLVAYWLQPSVDAASGGGQQGPVVAKRLGDVEIRYAAPSGATTTGASVSSTQVDALPDAVLRVLSPLKRVAFA